MEFIVKIDQREKKPWFVIGNNNHFKYQFSRNATADYTITGGESEIAIERKSLIDFFGTMILGKDNAGNRKRDRFENEIERMQSIRNTFIIVEAPLDRILQCGISLKGQIYKILLFRAILRLKKKYPKTRWIFATDRQSAEKIGLRILFNAYQKINR